MQKNRLSDIRRLTATAMLIALSVVFERLLPLVDAPEMRLSLGNVPIALASLAISPLHGAVCGILADIIGCMIKGYAPNPFLMIAPLAVGVLPHFFSRACESLSSGRLGLLPRLAITVVLTNLIASGIVTPAGLSFLYGTKISVLLVSRIPTVVLGTAVDIIVLYLILKSGVITKTLSGLKNGGKNKK